MRRGPDERGRPDADRGHAVEAFLRALEEGDLARLIRVVGPNPRVVVDDGDSSRTEGAPAGWCLLVRTLGLAGPAPLTWESRAVNGTPGLVGRRSGRVVTIVVLSGSVGEITDVWIVANREKLRHWNSHERPAVSEPNRASQFA